jgi:hypothetical protein
LIAGRSAEGSAGGRRRPAARRASRAACAVAIAASLSSACGKKGPPLPPLVHLPVPPGEFTAQRRGDAVDLQFVVPSANTDNTRPANVARVDVYAVTAATPVSEDQIVKQGVRVASVSVKSPKDPSNTIDEDDSDSDMEAPEGQGIDQGAVGRASETLTSASLVPVRLKVDRRAPAPPADTGDGPLLPPRAAPLTRTYVALGVSKSERKGPGSKPLAVPLLPPPAAPRTPSISYDEQAITLVWDPVTAVAGVQRDPVDDELPSRAIGVRPAPVAYAVYDAGAKPGPLKLTRTPIATPKYVDNRIVWGEERCYVVRAVQALGDLTVESAAAEPVCKTPTDTFAPAAPVNLQSTPTEGAINLIWDANTEKDLAGYIVLRGSSAATLQPVVTAPIQDTTFRDEVAPGIRFVYAVKAVDRAGNQSSLSTLVEEAAR